MKSLLDLLLNSLSIVKMKFHRNAAFVSFCVNPVWHSDVGKTLQRPPQIVSDLGQTSRAESVLGRRTWKDSAVLK